MSAPYFTAGGVDVYLGDYREVLPSLDVRPDSVVTDPPYGTTALSWDRWVAGWPADMAAVTDSLWSFLPMRAVLERSAEFSAWRYAQDVVWEKANGSGFARDRFRRVHEHAVHWYRGPWGQQHREVPLVPYSGPDKSARKITARSDHLGKIAPSAYVDTGQRLMRSVLRAPAVRYGFHPTEKPQHVLQALIAYSVPPGGLVLDPFAGSLSTMRAALALGCRGIAVEIHEPYAEAGAKALEAAIAGAAA